MRCSRGGEAKRKDDGSEDDRARVGWLGQGWMRNMGETPKNTRGGKWCVSVSKYC